MVSESPISFLAHLFTLWSSTNPGSNVDGILRGVAIDLIDFELQWGMW